LELSQAPVRWGLTYDEYIGEHERLRLGDAMWSRRVRRVVDALRPMYVWDRLYLGGGNSRRIVPQVLSKLGDDVVVVPNSAGIVGGVRVGSLPRSPGWRGLGARAPPCSPPAPCRRPDGRRRPAPARPPPAGRGRPGAPRPARRRGSRPARPRRRGAPRPGSGPTPR